MSKTIKQIGTFEHIFLSDEGRVFYCALTNELFIISNTAPRDYEVFLDFKDEKPYKLFDINYVGEL